VTGVRRARGVEAWLLGLGTMLAGLAAVATLLAPFAEASAQAAPFAVELAVTSCAPEIDAAGLRALLELELADDGVAEVVAAPAPGPSAPAVAIEIATECSASALTANLVARDRTTRKILRRAIDLSDVSPRSRVRALALAVAALLHASWAELTLPHAEAAARDAPRPLRDAAMRRARRAVANDDDSSARDAPSLYLGLAATGRWVERFGHGLLGARASIALRPVAALPLRFELHAGFDMARVEDGLGSIDVLHVFGGLAGLFEAVRGGVVELAVGPWLSLGYGRVSGASQLVPVGEGETWTALVGARTELGLALSRAIVLELGVEIAFVMHGIAALAGGKEAAGVDGALVGASLGVRFSPQ
jgi:hypothetical protein